MAEGKTTIRVIKSSSKTKRAESAKKPSKKDKKAPSDKPSRLPRPLGLVLKPFFAVGRYFKLSWIELRQVRWPNRRTTWKLTLMVIAYCAIFAIIIMLLDILFQFIFNKALG